MLLQDAIKLIDHPLLRNKKPGIWADLGCGQGLFTNALAQVIAPESRIYAVDKEDSVFDIPISMPPVCIEKITADFVKDNLPFNDLDGILMANSLHFVKDKTAFLKKIQGYFASKKTFLFIEYDMDSANPWVPYPVSFKSLEQLAKSSGYGSPIKIYELPSRYNRSNIYSAIAQSE